MFCVAYRLDKEFDGSAFLLLFAENSNGAGGRLSSFPFLRRRDIHADLDGEAAVVTTVPFDGNRPVAWSSHDPGAARWLWVTHKHKHTQL
jgi:hypothetical protein